MGIWVPETCWADYKCNKALSSIQLVFFSTLILTCTEKHTSNCVVSIYVPHIDTRLMFSFFKRWQFMPENAHWLLPISVFEHWFRSQSKLLSLISFHYLQQVSNPLVPSSGEKSLLRRFLILRHTPCKLESFYQQTLILLRN